MSVVDLVRAYPYTIRTYQVGGNGRLTLYHLFNLFQDVAHQDARRFGFSHPQMLELQRLWVLSRLSVEIDTLPHYDESIELLTWVKSVKGPRSEREFAIIYKNRRIVRASSLWVCLNSEDHRPATVPMEKSLLSLIHDEYAAANGAEKIIQEDLNNDSSVVQQYEPKYSDVDMVNHVNNASYVRWVMDLLRNSFPADEIQSFSINYFDEVHLGEKLSVVQHQSAIGNLYHDLIRAGSDKVVCKTKTVWKKA